MARPRAEHPAIAPIAILVGLILGVIIGAFHGWLIGYLTIPAFIVTLGGYLVWRNVAWHLTKGQTIGPLDENFQLFGGINGTLGETWSWIFGAIAILGSFFACGSARRAKVRMSFRSSRSGPSLLLGGGHRRGDRSAFVATVLNSYEIPTARLRRIRGERRGPARGLRKATACRSRCCC
jgi:D-xylose transport system permease protein